MRIAIIGAGQVGAALGRNWAGRGHDVAFGLREPQATKHAGLATAGALRSPADAVREAEAVVLAVPWGAAEAVVKGLGAALAGRLLLDATNPLAMGREGLGLALGHTESAGERVAAWAPGAAVFKTLNTVGAEIMADPSGFPVPPVMFVAGDDAARKPAVLGLVADLGFAAVDAGPLRNARLLEAHAMLWIDLALGRGQGRGFAFGMLRRG